MYARGHASDEEYVCIGFDDSQTVQPRKLMRSIVEDAIMRLTEQPKAARAVREILTELGFSRDGLLLHYLDDPKLPFLFEIRSDVGRLQKCLEEVARTGAMTVTGGMRYKSLLLQKELRFGEVFDIAEALRESLSIVHRIAPEAEYRSKSARTRTYSFEAFRSERMSEDYATLQALTLLRRLGILSLQGCVLNLHGEVFEISQASSGQQQLICSFLGLAAALEDDAVVLIDEPELSLHPKWQMDYLMNLERIVKSFERCHIVVATHSPVITQQAMVKDYEIVSLDAAGGSVELISDTVEAEGNDASVEKALLTVFKAPVQNSQFLSNEIFTLVAEAEVGGAKERLRAIDVLRNYLDIYSAAPAGHDMVDVLEKAIGLLESDAHPTAGASR
jgi:hypothetical protein